MVQISRFSLYFGEKTIKIRSKTGLKYREGGRTVGSGRVATVIE